jgi:hypothetical protein
VGWKSTRNTLRASVRPLEGCRGFCDSVTTKPAIPMSIAQSRHRILTHIAGRKGRSRSLATFIGRNLTGEICHGLNSPKDLFILKYLLEAPRNVTSRGRSAYAPRSAPLIQGLLPTLEESCDFPRVSKSIVHKIPRSTERRAGWRV